MELNVYVYFYFKFELMQYFYPQQGICTTVLVL